MAGFAFGGEKQLRMPEIGLGTWRIGGGFTPDHSLDEYNVETLRKAIDMGYSLIDTAEMYGSGNTETLVGKAIDDREVMIATKVSQSNLRYDDVMKAAERSITRLGVDAIDLYQIHWPNDNIPLKETMRAMEKLVEDGRVRNIGVSNFDVQLMEDARSYLSRQDIVTNQVSFSLLDRRPECDVMDYCRKANIGILAYEPLARQKVFRGGLGVALAEVGGRHGKTQAQVALNWIICKGSVPIPKSTDVKHLAENLGAADWRMTANDMGLLETASHA